MIPWLDSLKKIHKTNIFGDTEADNIHWEYSKVDPLKKAIKLYKILLHDVNQPIFWLFNLHILVYATARGVKTKKYLKRWTLSRQYASHG